MKSGTRDEAEGKWHEVKGKIKEIAGKLSVIQRWKLKVPMKK